MGILDDKREIESAWSTGPDALGAHVGYASVTAIKPYHETGHCSAVWLEVWKGDALVCRLNTAYMAEVKYKE